MMKDVAAGALPLDLQICFPSRTGVSVGIRLASAIARAGSRDAALAVTARLLADETDGSAAAWRRSDGVMTLVAVDGLAPEVRSELVLGTSPWRGTDHASLRRLTNTFAQIVGSAAPTVADLDVGVLLLSEACPEVEASRDELASVIRNIPDVDPVIVLEDVEGSFSFERDAIDRLTPREREILDLLALGNGTKQIADHLVISSKTVKTHVQNILAKLGAASRLEAVAMLRLRSTSSSN
jgi:DNA-binding CsgD family transcriptional regulator